MFVAVKCATLTAHNIHHHAIHIIFGFYAFGGRRVALKRALTNVLR